MRKTTKCILAVLFVFGMAFTAFAGNPLVNKHYSCEIDGDKADFYFLDNWAVFGVNENDWEDTYGSFYYYHEPTEAIYLFTDSESFLDFDYSIKFYFDPETKSLVGTDDDDDIVMNYVSDIQNTDFLVGKKYSLKLEGESMVLEFLTDNIVFVYISEGNTLKLDAAWRYVFFDNDKKLVLFGNPNAYMDVYSSYVLLYNSKKDIFTGEIEYEKVLLKQVK